MSEDSLPAIRPADQQYEDSLRRLKERDLSERDLLGRIVAVHAERLDNLQEEQLRLRTFVHEARSQMQAVISSNGALLIQVEKILNKIDEFDKTSSNQAAHEKVCEERQKFIAAHMEDSKKERGDIRNDLKWLLRSVLAGALAIIGVLFVLYVLPGRNP